MTGYDVNPQQIAAARRFLEEHVLKRKVDDDFPITSKASDLTRLIAWYGAIRAEGVVKFGPESVNTPGRVGLVERST